MASSNIISLLRLLVCNILPRKSRELTARVFIITIVGLIVTIITAIIIIITIMIISFILKENPLF